MYGLKAANEERLAELSRQMFEEDKRRTTNCTKVLHKMEKNQGGNDSIGKSNRCNYLTEHPRKNPNAIERTNDAWAEGEVLRWILSS